MILRRLINSFKDAARGLNYVFKNEQNFKIQIAVLLVIVFFIIYFPLRKWEIITLLLLSMLVLSMELLNTALERFADLLKPRLHHYVLIIKDIMAGAVLITSLFAAIIGIIIFYPYFVNLLK